jgi:hypothetical protein
MTDDFEPPPGPAPFLDSVMRLACSIERLAMTDTEIEITSETEAIVESVRGRSPAERWKGPAPEDAPRLVLNGTRARALMVLAIKNRNRPDRPPHPALYQQECPRCGWIGSPAWICGEFYCRECEGVFIAKDVKRRLNPFR